VTAPTVSITAPLNGATVVGTVSINATASDNVGVTKVEFYIDGALASTDTTSPYSYSWDSTSVANGSHSLTAKAYDAALNVGTSAAVNVTVNNPTGTDISGWTVTQANATVVYTIPAGTVIPANGYVVIARDATKAAFQTFWGVTLASNVVYLTTAGAFPQINGSENYTLKNVSGTVSVTATASDNVGVTKVEFYLDGVLQSTVTTSPYAWSWNTATATNASHSLTAKAYDAANNIGTSSAVSVTVNNAGGDTTPPTVSITAPANGATVSGTVSITATASDNVGVTKVEFYVDGALRSTDTTTPYSWSWDTTSFANSSHTIVAKAYDAANNVGTSSNVTVTVNNTVAQQLLGNPGFETGTAAPWTASAGIIDNSTGEAAHSGSWKAWLDGYGSSHTDTLLQQVTIASTATSAT
ncbi:MAG TPA: Ig-like domain-containing protein, partial [Mycobacteriales bacterium]|nr:Ig-like domain-containing protein [Mycobacteriales bacterium]